jgi:purine-binding chemotaxis protein CheW
MCAIPVVHVSETMRPLPIEAIEGAPRGVCGVSVIRGQTVPVVDLGALLGDSPEGGVYARFVTIRLGSRSAALAVGHVSGLQRVDEQSLEELPPLLREADAGLVESIAVSDAQLLFVLRAARIVPDGAWSCLDAGADAP